MATLTDREKLIASTWARVDIWAGHLEENGINVSEAIAQREASLSEGKTEEEFKQSKYDGGEYIVKSDWINEQQKSIPREEKDWEWSRQQIELQRCMEKYNALEDTKIELQYLLSDLIGYDWYNNEGGQGRVILDTTKKTVTVEGQQNTNAHITVDSKRYLDNSKPFVETVGNEVVNRGW